MNKSISVYFILFCFSSMAFLQCGKQETKDLHIKGNFKINGVPLNGQLYDAMHHFCGFCPPVSMTYSYKNITQGIIDTVIHDFDNRKYYFLIVPDDTNLPLSKIITFNCDNNFTQNIDFKTKETTIKLNVKTGDSINNLKIVQHIQTMSTMVKDVLLRPEHQNRLIVFNKTQITNNEQFVYKTVEDNIMLDVQFRKNNKDSSFVFQTKYEQIVNLNL